MRICGHAVRGDYALVGGIINTFEPGMQRNEYEYCDSGKHEQS